VKTRKIRKNSPKNQMHRRFFRIIIVFCAVSAAFFIITQKRKKPVVKPLVLQKGKSWSGIIFKKVTVILPLSGPFTQEGIAAKRGIDLAVAHRNSVEKNVLAIRFVDWSKTPIDTLTKHSSPDTLYLVHMPCKTLFDFASVHKGSIIIAPATSNEILTKLPNVQSLIGTEGDEGCFVARLFLSLSKKTSIGIIVNDTEYGKVIFRAYRNAIGEQGESIPYIRWKEAKEKELDTFLNQGLQLLWLCGDPEWIITNYTKIKARGYRGFFLVPRLMDYYFTSEIPKGDIKNFIFLRPYTTDFPSEENKSFLELYRHKYLDNPNWVAAVFYDAMNLIIKASENRGTSTIVYYGVSGRYRWDRNGIKGNAFHLAVFRNGLFTTADLNALTVSRHSFSGKLK